jgi:hypothetical protein
MRDPFQCATATENRLTGDSSSANFGAAFVNRAVGREEECPRAGVTSDGAPPYGLCRPRASWLALK